MRWISVSSGLFGLLLLITVGCSQQTGETQASSEDTQVAQQASQKLLADFQKTIRSELVSALNTGGSAHAIEVCQKRAPEITSSSTGSPVVTIKRVSDRNRNPINAASVEETAVLAKFATDNPPGFVDEWVTVESVKHYRFYQPIHVQAMCLKCHGPFHLVDDATAATLTSLYPNDKAVEYATGDLRGMFVVDMVWPDAKPYVTEVVEAKAEGQ